MVDHSHQSILELGPQLDDELVGRLDGEGRGDEADVQGSAEGHEHVDRLPVIQANDGVHTLGELGANCQREKTKGTRTKLDSGLIGGISLFERGIRDKYDKEAGFQF